MPKFSIIIPVYNVKDYIKRCLDSVFSQTYKDYEVIVVNDGTQDTSMDLVKDYDVNIINQTNQGLSVARNNGVNVAKGEYLIFLDSDDYLNRDVLEKIDKSLFNDPDIVRFQIREVFEDGRNIDYAEEGFVGKNGVDSFNLITKYHFVENAWCYSFKRSYYLSNKFKFMPNTYHEDFGIIPLIIMKADCVNSIDYIGYNYVQRSGSIMNSVDYVKTKKKVEDFYNHYKFLISEIDKTDLNYSVFKSFISNSLLLKITELRGADYKRYLERIKKDNVYDNLFDDSFSRKVKKIILRISPKLFFKFKG